MLYLDYAKPLAGGGGYILSFFADSAADLESISHGQKFVTKNGTDYGVPQAGSTVIVTSPNSGKTTYVMDAEGVWVVTEDISYSAVVANPSDAATAKLEKLKVNDTTYANWTENEIKALAGKGEDGVSVTSFETVSSTVVGDNTNTTVRAHYSNNTSDEFVVTAKNGKIFKKRITITLSSGGGVLNYTQYASNNADDLDTEFNYIGGTYRDQNKKYYPLLGVRAYKDSQGIFSGLYSIFNPTASTFEESRSFSGASGVIKITEV